MLLKNMFNPEESVCLPLTCMIIGSHELFIFRETERDWDKELAEDVKGECEQQYGPVDRIKVEKETQVWIILHVLTRSFLHIAHNMLYRVRSTSGSALSMRLAMPSRVSTVVGSEEDPSRPHSSRTPSCKLTSKVPLVHLSGSECLGLSTS